MKRPAGLTIIGVLMVLVAAVLVMGGFGSLFIATMGITDEISGDPVSAAITGMALGGGFSLLILAAVAANLAIGVFKMREWAWSVSIAWIGAGMGFTVLSFFAFRGDVLLPFGPSLVCHLLVVATAGWMLAYLTSPRVKRAFSALSA